VITQNSKIMEQSVAEALVAAIDTADVDALNSVLKGCNVDNVTQASITAFSQCGCGRLGCSQDIPLTALGYAVKKARIGNESLHRLAVVDAILRWGVDPQTKVQSSRRPIDVLCYSYVPHYRSLRILFRYGLSYAATDGYIYHTASTSKRIWPYARRHYRCERVAIAILGLRRHGHFTLFPRDVLGLLARTVMSTRYEEKWDFIATSSATKAARTEKEDQAE
jgi:hypothetical protein